MDFSWHSLDLVLYAPNVHQGGGRTLLLPVLKELAGNPAAGMILDHRLRIPDSLAIKGPMIRVFPDLKSRLVLEYRLRRLLGDRTIVLCMGNLPPLLARQGQQVVFLQNRYLVDHQSLAGFELPIRLRIALERRWLKACSNRVIAWVVQGATMAGLVRSQLDADTIVMPLVPDDLLHQEKAVSEQGKE
ncbi:hypothetical protein D6779_02325, partial [Candidatus Parcubacteria bacterium]